MEKLVNKFLSSALLSNNYVKLALVLLSIFFIYKFGEIVGRFIYLLFN